MKEFGRIIKTTVIPGATRTVILTRGLAEWWPKRTSWRVEDVTSARKVKKA